MADSQHITLELAAPRRRETSHGPGTSQGRGRLMAHDTRLQVGGDSLQAKELLREPQASLEQCPVNGDPCDHGNRVCNCRNDSVRFQSAYTLNAVMACGQQVGVVLNNCPLYTTLLFLRNAFSTAVLSKNSSTLAHDVD